MIGSGKIVLGALLRPRRLAHAHSEGHSYATVEIERADVSGTVQFPIDQLNEVLGTSVPMDEAGAMAALTTERPNIEAYIHEHFALSDGDRSWPVVITGFRVMARSRFSFAIFEYRVEPRVEPLSTQFTVSFDGIVHALSDAEAVVVVRRPTGVGPMRTTNQQEFLASEAGTTHHVVVPEGSWQDDVTGAVGRVFGTVDEVVRRGLKRVGLGRGRRRRTL